MLLTLTLHGTADTPATDLGFLLHKHPERAQSTQLPVGLAHVFYPEASERCCTAALLLEVDPVALVRGRRLGGDDVFSLAQYVNDRPYAASSLLAVALGRVFRTALAGRCDARPDLVQAQLPLEVTVPALPCREGPGLARRLLEPLGWQVQATPVPLDPQVDGWGDSRYLDVVLRGRLRLRDALAHLYVLLPVLDDAKHYWVGPDEVDKLVRAGQGWLADHPERELVTRRYLGHHRSLVTGALERLAELDDTPPDPVPDDEPVPAPLAQRRRDAVLAVLREVGARRVVDLGCGEGALLQALLADPAFTRVVGVDVAPRALERAARRLHLDTLPERQRERVELLQSSVTYRDDRLAGYDALVLMEVVEHVDPPRLPALERSVLAAARPAYALVTTPNAEHNVRFPGLPAGAMRHRDHRFEWTRAQFRAWAHAAGQAYGYDVRHLPVGDDDPEVGPPTQLAVFTRRAA